MSIDFFDQESLDAFAAEVDDTLARDGERVSSLWWLIVVWLCMGGVLSAAFATDQAWLYVIGFLGTIGWTLGFWLAKGRARWFHL